MPRIIFRVRPDDAANLGAIAKALHAGRPFVTKTAALRHALAIAADHLRAQAANAEAAQGRDN